MHVLLRRTLRLFTLMLMVAAAWPSVAASADTSAWQAISPSTPLLSFAIDPANEQQVYTGGPGGLWQSTDGGATWQKVGATALGHDLAIDPFAPNVIYASAFSGGTSPIEDQLLKSADGGATWSKVYQVPAGGDQSAIDGLLAVCRREGASSREGC